MNSIRNKGQYFDLWHKGLLGNKLRSWSSLKAVLDDPYSGHIVVRYLEIARKGVRYSLPKDTLEQTISEMITESNLDERSFIYNESAPDNKLIIQGEVMRDVGGLYLFYSTLKEPMRKALEKQPQERKGLLALLTLQHYLDPCSYVDLETLLDNYPDHVVEFSTYSISLGHIPHRNTIIWEVRWY